MLLKRTNSTDPDFQQLAHRLNQYLQQQYGALQDFYSQFNSIDHIQHVILIYIDQMPAGCGCFKPFDEKSVEVKRMFVADEFRGKGVGRAVLSGLEKWAAEIGYSRMVLEMGNRQPEAAILYRNAGYMVIPNYGQYIGMEETSICMEKSISGFPNS